jgi:hypothetical protein
VGVSTIGVEYNSMIYVTSELITGGLVVGVSVIGVVVGAGTVPLLLLPR